jgi:hypothetical protein
MYNFASKLFAAEKKNRKGEDTFVCGIRRREDNALIFRFTADETDLANETFERLLSGVTA